MKRYLVILCLLLAFAITASASITSFPNGVSSFGIPLIGSGPILTTGKVYFVSSSNLKVGSNGNPGTNQGQPFKTIDYAVGRCVANQGDVIIVMPGHQEVIVTSGLTIDVNGITIRGIGSGDLQPKLTVGTAGTGVNIPISASDVLIENINFVCGVDATEALVYVTGDDVDFKGNRFTGTATEKPVTFVSVTNNVSGLKLRGNKCLSTTAGGASWILLGSSSAFAVTNELEDIYVGYNVSVGNFSRANIDNTVTINNFVSEHNIFKNSGSSYVNVSLNATTSGVMVKDSMSISSASEFGYVSPSNNIDVKLIECYGSNVDGGKSLIIGQ